LQAAQRAAQALIGARVPKGIASGTARLVAGPQRWPVLELREGTLPPEAG